MCLVPNMVVLKKFHIPEFIKYTRTLYLSTYLRSYCNMMIEVMHDEKPLMHFFQDSLNEADTLGWIT